MLFLCDLLAIVSSFTGNIKYKKLVDNLRERLAKASELVSGLYSNTVHIQGQHFLKEDRK